MFVGCQLGRSPIPRLQVLVMFLYGRGVARVVVMEFLCGRLPHLAVPMGKCVCGWADLVWVLCGERGEYRGVLAWGVLVGG